MKLYLLILAGINISLSIKIKLELQRNILKFGYGINYKYEGMLAHSFDRFYIVTKFILPSIEDTKFSKLKYDNICMYMNKEYAPNTDSRKYLTALKTYCNKIRPFVSYYRKLINSYNITAHNIIENEIKPLLPQISKQKCGIITTLVSGFIGLAYEGISSFLQGKCKNALQKVVDAMSNEARIQCNKLIKLDNTMLMYGIYNAETLEKLINTVQEIHNVTSSHEKLFAGEYNPALFRMLYTDALGIQQYAINSLLFLRVILDNYISLYRGLITQLHTYASAIRVLARGYMPNTLITPRKLQEILPEVKKSLYYTNPDYILVLDRLHLYYDMQLVTFGIDKDMNLVMQFPVFIQPYMQRYQLETVPVQVLDENIEVYSYTHLKVRKPYIALNSETHISLTHQELRSCKKIGNEFYCEDLFIVKHKSSYSCESAIYFNLTMDIIKNNCDFDFHFNNTEITPTVLDGGDEIILANWPNDKHLICNINNVPFKIPSHPYVLVNRSILCNCRIEADNHHLLESIASCDKRITKLTMYFTINLVFKNYLDMFPNLTDTLTLIRDKTSFKQPLPIHINIPYYDSSLNKRPTKLKDFLNNYIHTNDKEIFYPQQRHTIHTLSPYKNIFLNQIVSIFTFTTSIISIVTIMLVIYLFCKHKHIRMIIASLILYITKVEANSKLNTEVNDSECSTLAYIAMALTILSMATVIFSTF